MIPVQELRVGNWINPTFPMKVTGIFSDVIYADFDGNEGDVWEYKEKDIEPIPLTEDILLKCGFEKSEYNSGNPYFYIIINNKIRIDITYEFGHYFFSLIPTAPLENLHQLQNLIYSITGEELQFKQ